jgi:hypothetical protein
VDCWSLNGRLLLPQFHDRQGRVLRGLLHLKLSAVARTNGRKPCLKRITPRSLHAFGPKAVGPPGSAAPAAPSQPEERVHFNSGATIKKCQTPFRVSGRDIVSAKLM